jgi:predicted PurR-regulated permease PerM
LAKQKPVTERITRERALLLLLVGFTTIALIWILLPFYGSILWAVIFSLLFFPGFALRAERWPKRSSGLAGIYTLIVLGLFVVPAIAIGTALIQQVATLAVSVREGAGQVNLTKVFSGAEARLPDWIKDLLERMGIATPADLASNMAGTLKGIAETIARRSVDIGGDTLGVLFGIGIMLYLFFFFLRDGEYFMAKASKVVPMEPAQRNFLIDRFSSVMRATVKGGMTVALIQGFAGGILFALLGVPAPVFWGVLMGIFALVPAIGTGIIWLPMAIFLLLTGNTWQGVVLLTVGAFGISMIDNVLRPILVGKEAGLPDFIVLLTTLGGVSLLGFNGVVLGPMIAAMCFAAWQAWSESHDAQLTSEPALKPD